MLLCAAALAQAPRPLRHTDYDSWRMITSQALSRDGHWLAYAYMPEDADGDVIVTELASGKEYKVPAGTLPQPPITPPEEINPEAPSQRPAVKLRFSADARWLVISTFPNKAEVEQARKEIPSRAAREDRMA